MTEKPEFTTKERSKRRRTEGEAIGPRFARGAAAGRRPIAFVFVRLRVFVSPL